MRKNLELEQNIVDDLLPMTRHKEEIWEEKKKHSSEKESWIVDVMIYYKGPARGNMWWER